MFSFLFLESLQNTTLLVLCSCELHTQTTSGGVYKLKYTTVVVLAYIARNEVARVSPGVLACSGSTIASIIAYTMSTHRCSCFARVRCMRQTRSSGVYKLKYCSGIHCTKRSCTSIVWRTGPFGLHDSSHDSPSPSSRAPRRYFLVRGPGDEREAAVYLSQNHTNGGV